MFPAKGTISSFIFKLFKCNSLYFKIQEAMQNKIVKEKDKRIIKNEIRRIRKKENEEENLKCKMDIK